ncbi:hypothetical protein AB0K27_08230 [Micromonospora echinospora]|uniref:dsDNA nuclease domain-containing protein n=1 Tax=Micromonospora echinospora TaxID=1877 RepID=UPI00343B00A3
MHLEAEPQKLPGTRASSPVEASALEAGSRYQQVAIDDLLQQRPHEDIGVSTSQDYRYQAEITASFCISMLTKPQLVEVICEWHEDIVLRFGSPQPALELVSVKHRTTGPWPSISLLCEKGGLAHLFDRWMAYDQTARVRVCTNARLGGSEKDPSPRLLGLACQDGDFTSPVRALLVTHVAWGIIKAAKKKDLSLIPTKDVSIPKPDQWHDPTGLPMYFEDQVKEFLRALRLDCGRPDKPHAADVHIRRLVEPALRETGLPVGIAPDVYKALVDEIAAACRDEDGNPRDLAAFIVDPFANRATPLFREILARRTINKKRIEAILDAAQVGKTHAPLLPSGTRPPRAPGGRKMRSKMADASIDEGEQENAANLRDLWIDTWPRVSTGFPEDIQTLYTLELEILDIVREVRVELSESPTEPFGPRFQVALHRAIKKSRLSDMGGLPLSHHHLIGFAYELSDLCKFRFTRLSSATS